LATGLIAKLNYENASSQTMLGHFEKIDETSKSRGTGQLWCDIGQWDLEKLRNDDFAGRQRIATTDFYVRSLPQTNGGRDLTTANTIAE
jgi:hypothetical protein